MRRLFVLILFLAIFAPHADGEESVRSGRWHDPSTWSGGQIPDAGSSVIISHSIILDGEATVGTGGPAGSVPALTLRPGGGLVISAGRTLRAAGDISVDDAELAMEQGSSLELHSSGPAYRLAIGGPSQGARARLVTNGTASAPCSIRSVGSPGSIVVSRSGSVTLAGTIVASMGDESTPALAIYPGDSGIATIDRVVFDGGGAVETSAIPPSGIFALRNVTFRSTRAPQSLVVTAHEAKLGGAREIASCVFDRPVRFWPGRGFAVKGSVFLSAFEVLEGAWETFEGNLVRMSGSDLRIAGSTSRNYWLVDDPAYQNPHFLQALSFSGRVIINEDIFEFNGSDANGDCIMAGLPPSASELVITRNIVLPNAGGDSSCTLFSLLGSPNVTVVAEHNTYIVGSQGAAVGETYAGHPGMLSSFRSNLAWDTIPRGFKLYDSGNDEQVLDLVAGAAADYNGGSGFLEGSNGRGYNNLEISSGSLGAHDVLAEPEFADRSRNIAAWSRALGGPGTAEHALSLVSGMNDPGGEAFAPSVLHAWVRQGFVPKNPALRGSGHDGLDIGALQVGAVIPVPTFPPTATHTPAAGPTASPSPSPASTRRPRPTEKPNGTEPPPRRTPDNRPPRHVETPAPGQTPEVEQEPLCRCHVRCRKRGARRRCSRHIRCGEEVTIIRGIKCRRNARVNRRMRCSKRFRRACDGDMTPGSPRSAERVSMGHAREQSSR